MENIFFHIIMKCLTLWVKLTIVNICWKSAAHAWSLSNVLLSGTKATLSYTDSVAKGIERGMEECKTQFAWDRWNCPDQAFTKTKLLPANRETAFVHSITAAGVTFTITKNCSLGHFENCGCDDSKLKEKGSSRWTWGGCSDNIRFGFGISRDFLDSKDHGKDLKAEITRHNNQAGRQAVLKSMKRMCKCHGVSGSCSVQTCWMQLSDFRTVGALLRNRYDKAVKLNYENVGQVVNGKVDNAEPGWRVPESNLVYLEKSPDYCFVNLTAGSQGTLGRECSRNGEGGTAKGKSCHSLCRQCGLKVKKKMAVVRSSCNCKFHWCCEVKCQKCSKRVNIHTCYAP